MRGRGQAGGNGGSAKWAADWIRRQSTILGSVLQIEAFSALGSCWMCRSYLATTAVGACSGYRDIDSRYCRCG